MGGTGHVHGKESLLAACLSVGTWLYAGTGLA